MGLQVTASKTDLFFNCQRPFDPAIELDSHEGGGGEEERRDNKALYGSAFHKCMELWALGRDSEWRHYAADVAEMLPDIIDNLGDFINSVEQTISLIEGFMGGDNHWGVPFRIKSAEEHIAVSLSNQGMRRCEFDREAHHYELMPGEVGGTADLVLESLASGLVVVLDYKTGTHHHQKYFEPSKLEQMLTLGIAYRANGLAILHAPPGGVPILFSEPIEEVELEYHRQVLASKYARIGDGSMRPGTWCGYCPAKGSCPTQSGMVVQAAAALVPLGRKSLTGLAEVVDMGKVHLMLGEYDKLAKLARQQIRDAVIGGEVIERPDGKTLVMVEKSYESLSKSSVLKALGPIEGAKEIDRLRELGCLVEASREEMHAK